MVLLLCTAESATVELHNRFIGCWYFSDSSLNEFLHVKQFGCNRGCNNTQMEHELTKIWKENDKENDEWKKIAEKIIMTQWVDFVENWSSPLKIFIFVSDKILCYG